MKVTWNKVFLYTYSTSHIIEDILYLHVSSYFLFQIFFPEKTAALIIFTAVEATTKWRKSDQVVCFFLAPSFIHMYTLKPHE